MEYFGRTYAVYSETSEPEELYLARVQLGIAKGHQSMGTISSYVSSAESMHQLLSWKHKRAVSESGDEEEVSEDEQSDTPGDPDIEQTATHEDSDEPVHVMEEEEEEKEEPT